MASRPEDVLHPRLRIFPIPWTAQEAEAICSGEGLPAEEVAPALARLAAVGVLLSDEGKVQRYRWAVEPAADAYLPGWLQDRHRDHFLHRAEQAEPLLTGTAQAAELEALEGCLANFRQALGRCLARPDGVEPGLRLAGALGRFWWMRGHALEGRRWLEAALRRPGGAAAARARALRGAGAVAYAQADYRAARGWCKQALALSRALGDRKAVAATRNQLGMVAREQGNLAGARTLHEQALRDYRALADGWGIASCVHNLGVVALLEGKASEALARHRESLALRRELRDDLGVASSLSNVAHAARAAGDLRVARAGHEECLKIRRRLGDRWGMAGSLLNLAGVAGAQGDLVAAREYLCESMSLLREVGDGLGMCEWLEAAAALAQAQQRHGTAVRLLALAERRREALNAPLPSAKHAARSAALGLLRRDLGEDAYAAAWVEGEGLTLEEAGALALPPP